MVSGVGALGREFAVDRGVLATRVGLNVAVTLGKQVPKKKPRTDETPSPPTATAPLSGNVCAGQSQAPECMQVMQQAPEPLKVVFAACVQATASASEAKNFDTQPEACRTAGKGITKYLADNKATMDPATQRTTYVAAAASYDFAGAGFELRGGKLGADHCAMVEATYNAVLGDEPTNPVLAAKVSIVDAVVTECRKTFTCSTNADGDMVCTAK